jgi:hypothetical protein
MKNLIMLFLHRCHRHYPMIFLPVVQNVYLVGAYLHFSFSLISFNKFLRIKCTIAANHQKDNIPHECNQRCSYNKELDNEVWKCLQCQRDGRDTTVYGKLITKNDGLVQGLLKYVWSGCVIECPYHGEIYRSRKHWYGNTEPKDVTRSEVIHVWIGDDNSRLASDVTPRKFMELIVYASRFV